MIKQYKPNIVRGGVAVPLGNNYFFMKGRKHEQGGIDVGKDLEVQDGEVMKLTKYNIKVFSADPFLNGKSPVDKLFCGENPNKVFAQQERFKKVNKINDDGTKAQLGKGKKITTTEIPESQQYAVTTPDGQRKIFNSKQEASDYIIANTPKGYSLYDTTNYGTNIDKGQTAILNRNTEREIEKATKQEELAKARLATIQQNKEAGKEMLSYMPVIGDGMDLYQLGKDVYNGNYLNAGIGLGLLALPNVIEKPIKYVGRGIKNFINKGLNVMPEFHIGDWHSKMPRVGDENATFRQFAKSEMDDINEVGVLRPETIESYNKRKAELKAKNKIVLLKHFDDNLMFNRKTPFHGIDSSYPYVAIGNINDPSINWIFNNHKNHKNIFEPHINGKKIVPKEYFDIYARPKIGIGWNLISKKTKHKYGGKINKFRNGGDITPEEEALWKANNTVKPASNYHAAKDMYITKTREDFTDFVQRNFPNCPTGLTNCTLTASQFFGDPIGRASTIVNNPKANNFYQVDEKYAVPGTMVIASDPLGTPNPKYHTMILSGYADKDYPFEYNGIKYNIKKGEPLVHYSKGKNNKESYKKNIPLRVYNDQSEGKTYNRYYRPYDKNGLPNVLLPELIVTNKKVMGGNHKLNTNQMANIYRVDSNGKTSWGMNFSTGGKSKGKIKAELGLKTKNDGSYYGYVKKDNKGNTWYIPTDEDLKLMYPGLTEDVDYNTLSDYDKMRYNEREAVKDGYRVRDTGEIFYVDDNTTFVNSGPTFNNTVDARDVNREIPKTYVSTKSNSSKSTSPKLRRKYWDNLSTYEDRLDNQVKSNKTNVVTPNTIKSTTNNKSVNYSVTNKKQTTPKQTTPNTFATKTTPKSNVTNNISNIITPNNVTRTVPIAKPTSQETPIFGLNAQNAFKKSIIGNKSNPDYIRGTFDFRDNKELVNKVDPNTIKVNPTNIRYKGVPSNGNYFKNYNAGDYISLGANVLGNIGSALINKHTLDNMEYASAPVPKMAIKQKTNFNINPQLDLSRERLREGVSDVNTNTASSSTALNRNNKLRLANIMNTNQLYATKENMETQLINADRMNQQNVFNSNIDAFNTWNKEKNIFETAKQEKYGENKVGAVQGISQAVHDFINNNEKRRQFNNSLISIMAANPNVNPEYLKTLGADWITDEHIRNWKLANNYKV